MVYRSELRVVQDTTGLTFAVVSSVRVPGSRPRPDATADGVIKALVFYPTNSRSSHPESSRTRLVLNMAVQQRYGLEDAIY